MATVRKNFDNDGNEIEEAGLTTESLLNFVDLAGSERLAHGFDGFEDCSLNSQRH